MSEKDVVRTTDYSFKVITPLVESKNIRPKKKKKKDVCLPFSDQPNILENLGCIFFFLIFNFAFLNKIVEIIIFKMHCNCPKS